MLDTRLAPHHPEFVPARRWFVATAAIMLAASCCVAISLPSIALAADPFDITRFEEAQRAGKTVVIGVHAGWCPVCAVQKRIVAQHLAQPALSAEVHFHVDFDRDKSVLKRFKVTGQSTIIVFKGTTETGRLTGETSTEKIEALLRSGL